MDTYEYSCPHYKKNCWGQHADYQKPKLAQVHTFESLSMTHPRQCSGPKSGTGYGACCGAYCGGWGNVEYLF